MRLLPAVLVALLAVALPADAQVADEEACDEQMGDWYVSLVEEPEQAGGGFACAVRCVETTTTTISRGEPSTVATPPRCAARWDYALDEAPAPEPVDMPDAPALVALVRGGDFGGPSLAAVIDVLILHAQEPAEAERAAGSSG